MFTLQPIEKFGLEMIQCLGLEDIEPLKNVNVKLLNLMTEEANYLPVQGLMEFGIFSIFLPGNKIPDWFSRYRNVRFSIIKDTLDEDVCSVSFTMPSHPDISFRGLSIGVVYSFGNQGAIYHRVANRTKDIGWVYSPTFSVAANDKDMIFLSHWNMENLLEAGDDLDICLSGLKLKKIEIQLVYDQHVQDDHCTTNLSLRNIIDNGNLSIYEFGRGRHFLCNYHYKVFQSPANTVWRYFCLMTRYHSHDMEQSRLKLLQYLMSSSDLQDSQHMTFGPATLSSRADLNLSYLLRLVCPILAAVDYHFRRRPSPISCVIAEMTTFCKWLIRYPDFVPDSNFIEGCTIITLAELAYMQERLAPRHFVKEIVYKLLRRASQNGQYLDLVNKPIESLWLEDPGKKVDLLMALGKKME